MTRSSRNALANEVRVSYAATAAKLELRRRASENGLVQERRVGDQLIE